MAYPQLSGKMVRLNGTNQNLSRYYPAPLSWNALFLRMAFNMGDPPGGFAMDFVTYGGCLLRLFVYNGFTWSFGTTTGSVWLTERVFPDPNGDWGPLHSVMAWDGTNVALYIGGRRVYKAALGGAFSGPTPYMSVGSRYEGPSVQPFKGDIGHIILHNAIPAPYAGLPEHVYDGELTATEFLRAHGLSESDVLVLYDWRSNDGTNHGIGGSAYNLTPSNDPTFLPNEFQYELADQTTPVIQYPRASVLAARLTGTKTRARVRR